MKSLRRSLRAKFTLILLLVGILPLAGASAFFYFTAQNALFKNVFKELKWNAEEISSIIEGHFAETGKDILNASRNTAFYMYYIDTANSEHWVGEQHKALRHLRSIYPEMLDEACFIDASGHEVSRIVYDKLAHKHELSPDESRTAFFREAFKLAEGEVYQGRPAMSEDTKRWVLPNATPIAVGGRNAAILHFEVSMSYFQKLLMKVVNPDRGFAFILDGEGMVLAHTLRDISETEPFEPAIDASTAPDLRSVYGRMTAGESGIESFLLKGKEHYVIYSPIKTAFVRGRNDNRWSLAYVIPSERVFVEVDILRYNAIALLATAVLVIILAYVLGNYVTRPIRGLAAATNKVAAGEMPSIDVDREDEIGVLSGSFNMMVESIKRRDEALKALATTDGLTGLYNYRHFSAELDKAVKSAHRFGRSLSLIMADVDYFKHYNDTNGHSQGDMALKKVAEVILKNIREVDIAARYGGEEFVVILPETPHEVAAEIAERVRSKVEEEDVPNEERQPKGILSISLGVASFPHDAQDAQGLVERADQALYKAKENGRNQVWPPVEGGQT